MLTLFHPADGRVRRRRPLTTCPNGVLHPWLKRELSEILAELPEQPPRGAGSALRHRTLAARTVGQADVAFGTGALADAVGVGQPRPGTRRQRWSCGWSPTGSCPSTLLWAVRG